MHVLHAPTSGAPNREPYGPNSAALPVGWRGARPLTNSSSYTNLVST